MKTLTESDHVKVAVENAHLRIQLRMMYLAVRTGISALMIHPWRCVWNPDLPSISQLPQVQHLLRLQGTDHVRVDRCQMGANVRQPTGIITVHLHELRDRLRDQANSGRCAHCFGHSSHSDSNASPFLSCRDLPPGMSSWIAQCLFDKWRRRLPSVSFEFPDPELTLHYRPPDRYL